METQYDVKVKNIVTDNGGEFVNKAIQQWAASKGIRLTDTSSYTPEQNGIAERKNRTLADMVRCLLADSKLDKSKYWKQALAAAVYIRNRSPGKRSGQEMTPYEILTGNKPDLKHLRCFGDSYRYTSAIS
jgi:transposase InsO family protein